MAALIRHGLQGGQELQKTVSCIFLRQKTYKRNTSDEKPFKHVRLESRAESFASKGFLRSYKPYNPPENIKETLRMICESVLGAGATDDAAQLSCPETKFKLLDACFQEFQHGIPNSLLHDITTLGDVVQFYNTPTNVVTPFDSMKQANLPPNLHIQYEYLRFHPETDTKFGGISAFPGSSTIVTGLKYKKKYKGYKAKPLPPKPV